MKPPTGVVISMRREDADERADAGLHVGHEEIDSDLAALGLRAGSSAGVAGIKIGRRLLSPLRDHFRRVRFAGHAARAELFPLLVVFGLTGASIIDLRAPSPVFVIDLEAAFGLFGRTFLIGHREILQLLSRRKN